MSIVSQIRMACLVATCKFNVPLPFSVVFY